MPGNSSRTLIVGGLAVVAAGAAGFGLARLTVREAPPPAPAAEAEAVPNGVAVDAARLAAAGVQVEQVSAGGMAAEILAPATVHAAPDGEAVLTARAAGAVARLTRRLGDPVRAGEVLALVESRDAATMAADRSTAAARVGLARQRLAREQRLFDQKVSPRQDLEAAEAELAAAVAESRRADAAARAGSVSRDGRYVQVTSPIAGRVTGVSAVLGAFVEPQTELFRIADPARLQVEAAVSSADAPRIAPGDAAVVETPAGQTLAAAVRAVTPALSEETRTAVAVLALSGGGANLRPGEAVRVRITPKGAPASGRVVVPEEAVQRVEGRDAVFVRTPAGFRVQPVVVAARSGGRAEIAAGLTAGQSIATRNAFLLKAEMGKGQEEEE
jgi:cobalt-zinc-cadmium efflux system membrane fusion protein